jgi:hypothetical protein
MGFGFRKSFGSGPFRFTVSPRGVSSSFGVRGARITAGPRGTFVTISSHGAYYRHRIDTPRPRVSSPASPTQEFVQPPLDSVFQVPVAELAASNQTELLTKLNQNVSATNPAIILFVLSGLALFMVPSSPVVASVLIVVGLAVAIWLTRRFRAAHTHEIHYSLDADATERYSATQQAISVLGSCSHVWVLNTSTSTSDLKRNAGAGTLITRKSALIGALPTKGFQSSLPVSSVEANGTVFHFLPDQILLFSGRRYASIQYGQLSIEVRATRFIEAESVPSDSRQVDTTWRFVNKSGGPDRRFNNNRQIPVLQYGEVTLRTNTGLRVILQTSNVEKAQAFSNQVSGASNNRTSSSSASENRAAGPAHVDSSLLACYTLLGLNRPTTLDQAAAAHRQQASLYHPDKYEHLAPEMKALASAKMAEINAAYTLVKLDIAG